MLTIDNREEKKAALRSNMIDTKDEAARAKKKKKRKGSFKRKIGLLIVVLCVLLAAGVGAYLRFGKYNGYELSWEKPLSKGSLVGYVYYGDNVVKYSKDGASYIGLDGEQKWSESYEIKNPTICVNGDYIAIADQQGTTIEIFNKSGRVGTAKTLLPITKAVISQQGTVAAIIEDSSASYITFYDRDGSDIDVTIKSILSGDGYPTDISLSPDGTQLIAAYQYITASGLSGRVVFYDFSEIGQNIPNRLVGGFDEQFDSSLIGRVRFINSTYSIAAADTGLSFFTSKNLASPELITTVKPEGDIESLMTSDNYVGIISKATSSNAKHVLDVYKPNGGHVFKKDIDMDYSSADIDGNYIYIVSDNSCMIISTSGVVKYNGSLDRMPMKIKKARLPGEFICTGAESVYKLRFR